MLRPLAGVMFGLVLAAPSAMALTLRPGDILVTALGGVYRVDPLSGVQTLVAAVGDEFPTGIALDSDGTIVVADKSDTGEPGELLRIDPTTGGVTTISSGGSLAGALGVVIEASGDILVVDGSVIGTGGSQSLVRIDPATGAQATLATFAGTAPLGVALEADGDVIVADTGLVRIDPQTGGQTQINAGTEIAGALGVAVAPNGDLLATDFVGAQVVRVDPVSGAETLVSDGGGGFSFGLLGIAVETDGNLIVANTFGDFGPGAGTPTLLRVDPTTGVATPLASGGALSDGAGFIALVPDSTLIVDPDDDPLDVQMLGGTGTPGGLQVTLDALAGGSVVAEYDPLSQMELGDRILQGDFTALDFAVPGDTVQLWDIGFTGTLNGLATLVFRYDQGLLSPAFPEISLGVFHFRNGAWQRLVGVVDPFNDTITVQTDSFSPFIVGVPEPTPALLILLGMGAMLCQRRVLRLRVDRPAPISRRSRPQGKILTQGCHVVASRNPASLGRALERF